MAYLTYSEKLKDPRWQKKRLDILNRDNFTCQLCADKYTTLHIHHFCYNTNYNPWDVEDNDLITYCEHCHSFIEFYKNSGNIVVGITKNKNKNGDIVMHSYIYVMDIISIVVLIGIYKSGVYSFVISFSDDTIKSMNDYVLYPEKLIIHAKQNA